MEAWGGADISAACLSPMHVRFVPHIVGSFISESVQRFRHNIRIACAQFTEGQLQPAADKFSAEAEPQMKRVTEGGIRPAANQFDEQARAAAQQVRLECTEIAVTHGQNQALGRSKGQH